jgi:hypothetical protein
MFGLKKMKTVENTRNAFSLMSSKDVFDAKVKDLQKRLTAKQRELDESQADGANDASNHEEGVDSDEEGGHGDAEDDDDEVD